MASFGREIVQEHFMCGILRRTILGLDSVCICSRVRRDGTTGGTTSKHLSSWPFYWLLPGERWSVRYLCGLAGRVWDERTFRELFNEERRNIIHDIHMSFFSSSFFFPCSFFWSYPRGQSLRSACYFWQAEIQCMLLISGYILREKLETHFVTHPMVALLEHCQQEFTALVELTIYGSELCDGKATKHMLQVRSGHRLNSQLSVDSVL